MASSRASSADPGSRLSVRRGSAQAVAPILFRIEAVAEDEEDEEDESTRSQREASEASLREASARDDDDEVSP